MNDLGKGEVLTNTDSTLMWSLGHFDLEKIIFSPKILVKVIALD